MSTERQQMLQAIKESLAFAPSTMNSAEKGYKGSHNPATVEPPVKRIMLRASLPTEREPTALRGIKELLCHPPSQSNTITTTTATVDSAGVESPARSTGKLGVACSVGSTVGGFLVAAEHGSKEAVPDATAGGRGEQKRNVCSAEGCNHSVHIKGLCKTHCGNACAAAGCVAKVRARGFCGSHDIKKERTVIKKLVQEKPASYYSCAVVGCSAKARGRVLCSGHERGPCSVDGCNTMARKVRGMCKAHIRAKSGLPLKKPPAAPKVCSLEGCGRKLHARGLCSHHSRGPCSADGCETTATTAGGFCGKHGAHGECIVDSCSGNAKNKGGFCGRHGGKDGFCTTPGCETPRIPGVLLCMKHGGYGMCAEAGCTTNARGQSDNSVHTLPTENLLEDTDGCGSLRPSMYADVRYVDDVIAIEGHGKVCFKHLAFKPTCSREGCSTRSIARGKSDNSVTSHPSYRESARGHEWAASLSPP